MKFKIEKQRCFRARDGHHAFRSMGGEKLLTEFQPAGNRGERLAERRRRRQIGRVDGGENGIFRRLSHVRTLFRIDIGEICRDNRGFCQNEKR